MKMPVVAVVVGIIGLACVSYALYNIQHQIQKSRRFGTTYRSAFFESSIIGIFVFFYAVKSIDSFAAVFMGFTAVVVKDDQKYIQSLKCDSKVISGGCFFL